MNKAYPVMHILQSFQAMEVILGHIEKTWWWSVLSWDHLHIQFSSADKMPGIGTHGDRALVRNSIFKNMNGHWRRRNVLPMFTDSYAFTLKQSPHNNNTLNID